MCPFFHPDISDVKSVADPMSKVKAGLRGDGDTGVPLRSVHIRGHLVDLAAQVSQRIYIVLL